MTDETEAARNLGTALNSQGFWTWAWVFGLSTLGGVAGFYRKIKAGAARPFNVAELFGEIFISGFVGVATFLVLSDRVDPLTNAAMVAISGHMGSRFIFLLENLATNRIKALAGPDPESPTEPRA